MFTEGNSNYRRRRDAEKQTKREFEAKKQEDELSAELICTIITVNDEPFY